MVERGPKVEGEGERVGERFVRVVEDYIGYLGKLNISLIFE